MIRKALLGSLLSFAIVTLASAQEVKQWSLLECINYAHENNITVKRQLLNAEYQDNVYKQSKLNMLPNLNASVSGGLNFGYTWIQQSATNVDMNTRSLSTGISSNVALFEGLSRQNTIKKNKYLLMQALEDNEKTKNDITLQITAQYMQILFDKELLAIAKEQYNISQLQVERTQKLVDAGSVAVGNLLEIKSQAAKEALNITQQENNLNLNILTLAQLLDLENPMDFAIETPAIPELDAFTPVGPENIYQTAVGIMPQIKSSEYNVTSTEYDLKIAKGSYYPTLNLGANIGANANWLVDDPDGYNRPMWEQFKSTRNTYIGASLSIPIFNRLQTRNNVANAKLSLQDAQFQLQSAKLNLRKEIQQAYADAVGAYKQFLSSEEAVASYKESFRYTEKKYNVGLVNSVDYNVSKNDFTKAQSDLLQAKYSYILRTKILDFYKGIPIEL
nr:TolC family protein [uncultured Carboxylicivirga sp.]